MRIMFLVKNAVKLVVAECMNKSLEYPKSVDFLAEHRSGRAAYSLAGRRALADCREALRDLFKTLTPLVEI